IKQSGKLIHFQLSLTAGPPGSNMGLLDGTFMLHGAKGIYMIHFQLSLTAGPPGSNMGLLDGTFMLHGAKGIYRDNRNKCIIYFTILESKSAIKLRQSNRYRPDSYPCNFGYGVFADGIYKRVSTENPSLLGIGGPYSHK
ncbi:hypothetical protein, partial [Acidithiobacillus ferrianus]|uniref:hypothetical protein n=1 Tax=Acidithiobacillus ferrianus TaxID=2678518 RepID=UPI0034E4F201